jgi:hypothetical protein
MVDFVTAIATASQAIGLANQLRGAQKAYDEAEWKLKVADLNSVLADLKNALIDAKEESREKDDELEKLRKTMKAYADTIEVNGFRYNKLPDGNPVGHAYCPVCIQKSGFMFHLTRGTGMNEVCPYCKAAYRASVYAEP